MIDNTHKTVVPLRIGNLLFMSALLGIFAKIFCDIRCIRPVSLFHIVVVICLAIFSVGWLRSCVHYTFTAESLVVNFLGIPIRKIPWNRIGHAIYVHAWKDMIPKYSLLFGGIVPKLGSAYGQLIFVTLKGCPRFIPSYHIRLFHSLFHPFHAVCIWLPDSAKYQLMDAFQKYFPPLEKQPLDAWKNI